ncbi:MAG: hypothetical protein J6Q41_02540 [Firmicutes bacterium]|nr:hypothetical protein [Bacillota bacterium]
MKNKYFRLGIVYIILGAALFIASQITDLGDSTIATIIPGIGGALVAVGAIRMYRAIRLEKDTEYRENFEVETHDERNQWLRMKAWSWAGYLFVLIAACATLVFAIMDKAELMKLASTAVCLMLLLYWGCYMYVRKKY